MKFLDRTQEMKRLETFHEKEGGLGVIWGRRRIGKTRLLIDWVRKNHGFYWVADTSVPAIQRRYFAQALETLFPDFAKVEYLDWGTLLHQLAKESNRISWRGPLVIDELPYLVKSEPALPSILQRWIDHEAKGLTVVLAGSSRQIMQGMILNPEAPLYGRARLLLNLQPIPPSYIKEAFTVEDATTSVCIYSFWGGVPWYWELAAPYGMEWERAITELVLDPMGPLHLESDRLLMDEVPSAIHLRFLLDVIGSGSHRPSEIATRVAIPITSLSRPLHQLREMGLIEREIPFGTSEKSTKRALYKIEDSFLRFWFKAVAPKRSYLMQATERMRRGYLSTVQTGLLSQSWKALCRQAVPRLSIDGDSWGLAQRFWQGKGPEWDVVADNLARDRLLIGEVKWTKQPVTQTFINRVIQELMAKPLFSQNRKIHYVLFVPKAASTLTLPKSFSLIDAEQILRVMT